MSEPFQILTPCHQNWDAMPLTATGRHCAVCDREVVDFTDCDPAVARAALERSAAEGRRICARAPVDRRRRVVFSTFRRHVLTNGLAMLLGAGAAACEVPLPQDGAGTVGEGVAPAIVPEDPPVRAAKAGECRAEPVEVAMGDIVAVDPQEEAVDKAPEAERALPDTKEMPDMVVPQSRPQEDGEAEADPDRDGSEEVQERSSQVRIMRGRPQDHRREHGAGADDF